MKGAVLTIASLMLALAPRTLPAQTIYGSALEDSTKAPVANAFVELLSENGRRAGLAQTDSTGSFLLHPELPGRFRLRVTHPAYARFESDTISLRRDELIAIEINLAVAAVALEPLVVISRRRDKLANYYYRLQHPAFGRFVRRPEIDARPTARATDLLRAQPGIEIVAASLGSYVVTMHGGVGRCLPSIYIDGMKIDQFPEGGGLDAFITADILEGIEIYTMAAGVPAEFYSPNSCGVVAFWTRPYQANRKGRIPILGIGVAALLLGTTLLISK